MKKRIIPLILNLIIIVACMNVSFASTNDLSKASLNSPGYIEVNLSDLENYPEIYSALQKW